MKCGLIDALRKLMIEVNSVSLFDPLCVIVEI
jgi:hypothetical protein